MEENLKKALSELLVLAVLHERDHHAPELTAAILERSGGAISLTFPYAILYRMIEQGNIQELPKRVAPDGRRRQYFGITEVGRSYFLEIMISISLFLCLIIMLSPAAASETQERINFEDGSYAIITIRTGSMTRAVRDDSKTYTYYNPLGQRCFSYLLWASFTYNGTTSSADDVDFDIHIYRQGWDISTHREYISGNTAYGSATPLPAPTIKAVR